MFPCFFSWSSNLLKKHFVVHLILKKFLGNRGWKMNWGCPTGLNFEPIGLPVIHCKIQRGTFKFLVILDNEELSWDQCHRWLMGHCSLFTSTLGGPWGHCWHQLVYDKNLRWQWNQLDFRDSLDQLGRHRWPMVGQCSHHNGRSPINEGFNGKIIYKWEWSQ